MKAIARFLEMPLEEFTQRFVREVLGGSKRESRRRYPLNCGVICKVYKHHRAFYSPGLMQVVDKELSPLECDSHCGENDSEIFTLCENSCLPGYLSGYLVVWQACT